MATKNLLETATLVEAAETGTWKVRLISEGKGSSGIYSASLMENYGHAFNNSLSFENHPVGWDGPQSRNFTQIVGKVVGETWTDTDERGKVGVYANWEPDPDHRDRLARYKDNLGLSIYIEGEGHVDEDGEFVVDSFNAMDPFKSVDVVIAAGRGGRFEESMREIYSQRRENNKPSAEASAQENRKDKQDMEIKDVEALISPLTDKIDTLVSALTAKAEESAQKTADETAVAEALTAFEAAIKAIDEAGLLPSQVENLRAEAKAGKDVAPLIEAAKKVVTEARQMAESHQEGRIVGGSEASTFGAWK